MAIECENRKRGKMDIRDLGEINKPVLLFGGVYGNLQALEAVLAIAQAGEMELVCTGDIFAYCADGEACASLMQHRDVATIAGNCERNLAQGADDCGCGFAEGTTCERLSEAWFSHAQNTVSAASLGWMRDLPDRIVFTQAGKRYGVLHGGADDIARFVWPGAPEVPAQIAMAKDQLGRLDGVISGHCGLAFQQGCWTNAGAIGMPPNDGGPETRYAVLQNGEMQVRTLEYDHASARIAMQAAGLVQGYQRCLTTGHWPSEDVLPKWLRRVGKRMLF